MMPLWLLEDDPHDMNAKLLMMTNSQIETMREMIQIQRMQDQFTLEILIPLDNKKI